MLVTAGNIYIYIYIYIYISSLLTCFTSPFCHLEFWGGFSTVRKFLCPCSLDSCFQSMLFYYAASVADDWMGTKHWWSGSDRRKLKNWERNLSQCYFVYQKSQCNRPRTEPVSLRLEAGTKLLHDFFSGWFSTWWMNRWLAGWMVR